MNYNIRHIILPLLTAIVCAAASCTSDPYSELWGIESREEIKLELAPGSRTIITNNDNITDQPYMLFGDIKLGARLDTIFRRHSVKYNGKKWDYGVPQYWFMDHEHSFVAIHPFIPENDPQVSILEYKDSKLSFTYKLPEKLEEAKDLLFATYRRKYTLDNRGAIQFQFTHLLPRINVSMALIEKDLMYDHVDESETTTYNKNEYIAVHSIKFVDIKTKASFTFTPKPLTADSPNAYEMSYLLKDELVETLIVTLEKPCKVPNSYKYKEGVDDEHQELEYVTALNADEIIVMLPQSFDENSTAQMVVNYSINDDKDLMRQIVIPLKGTVWDEGVFYTYKLLIDDPYYDHIVDPSKISIDIDDFRLPEKGDDSWITDDKDKEHNINYEYENDGNCGPTNEE